VAFDDMFVTENMFPLGHVVRDNMCFAATARHYVAHKAQRQNLRYWVEYVIACM
jgi:hypothetical protein